MNINKVVVHELVKEVRKPIKPSNMRDKVLDPTHKVVVKLLEGIVNIYGKRHNSAHYGSFIDGPNRGPFPDEFLSYKDMSSPTDKDFMQLSVACMDRLYEKAADSTPSSGGYILFSDYTDNGKRFFLVVMIKKTEGMKLSEKLVPEELEQLDLDKLHQAARVNFDKLSEYDLASEEEKSELNYLSFISSSSSKAASGYFITSIGCATGATSSRATDNLISYSKSFFRDRDYLKTSQEDFSSALYSYLDSKLNDGHSVKLSEVTSIVTQHIPRDYISKADEVAEEYIELMNSEEVAIPTEFPVSKSSLDKHTRITAQGKGWKFSFDKLSLGDNEAADIYYNAEDKSLTINRLPKEVISKLQASLSEFSVNSNGSTSQESGEIKGQDSDDIQSEEKILCP